jgi:RimJ/RimL family protein N-acetyltransferase
MTTLTGPHFTLVPFEEAHITPRYLGWLNDPEVNRYLEVRFVEQTRDTALEFVRSFRNADKFMWGIYPTGSKEPVGTATLYDLKRKHGSCELGLLIGEKSHWGRRTAVEVIGMLARHAFGPLGLRRMTGGTYAEHHGMNFIYSLLGFRREGTLKSAHLLKPGTYVDGYRWAILADEWRQRHGD